MELVFASCTSTIGQAPIRRNRQNTVANSALADALKVQRNILAEQRQRVDNRTALQP